MKNQETSKQATKNEKKKKVHILSLLANNATGASRRLLKRHGIDDAKSHKDLEYKLAMLYKSKKEADEAPDLEKEFANIHPHKDLILKYCSKPMEKSDKEKEKEVGQMVKSVVSEKISNCEGNPDCGCNKKFSNACGCSGADGSTGSSGNQSENKQGLIIIGTVGVIALVSILAMYMKKN